MSKLGRVPKKQHTTYLTITNWITFPRTPKLLFFMQLATMQPKYTPHRSSFSRLVCPGQQIRRWCRDLLTKIGQGSDFSSNSSTSSISWDSTSWLTQMKNISPGCPWGPKPYQREETCNNIYQYPPCSGSDPPFPPHDGCFDGVWLNWAPHTGVNNLFDRVKIPRAPGETLGKQPSQSFMWPIDSLTQPHHNSPIYLSCPSCKRLCVEVIKRQENVHASN